MKDSWKRTAALVVTASVVIVGVVFLRPQSGESDTTENETVTVTRTTLTTTTGSTGTVEAEQMVGLSFGVSGTVKEVLVEVGDEVEPGMVLASLNTTDLEYQVELAQQSLQSQELNYAELIAAPTASEIAQANANVLSAQSELNSANLNLETAPDEVTVSCATLDNRAQTLTDAQADYDDYVLAGYEMDATFIPNPDSQAAEALRNAEQDYTTAQAQCNITTITNGNTAMRVESAEANLEQAQANLDALLAGATDIEIEKAQLNIDQARIQLEQAQADLANASLTAPTSGVVTEVQIVAGQTTTTANIAMTIADVSDLYLSVEIDEVDVQFIALEQDVEVTLDALEDVTLEGEIRRIDPIGQDNQGLVTYTLWIALEDSEDYPIRAGMTADVEIVLESYKDVLVVPSRAVRRDRSVEYLQVRQSDGSETRVEIETGVSSEGLTILTSGEIEEGAVVIVPERTNASSQQLVPPNPFGG